MGLIDAFVDAHNHRRNIENPVNFGDCMKGENPLHDGNHSGLFSRLPVNLPDETYSRGSKSEISSAGCQG